MHRCLKLKCRDTLTSALHPSDSRDGLRDGRMASSCKKRCVFDVDDHDIYLSASEYLGPSQLWRMEADLMSVNAA